MEKIRPEIAYRMMLQTLEKEQIEDRLYELAQDLFNAYAKSVENNEDIQIVGEDGTPYDDEDYMMWYDEYHDVFVDDVFMAMYKKLKEMME